MPVNCSLTGYKVYQGGVLIATTTSATYSVTSLTAGTQYSFTVAAYDSFGVSAQSSPVSVTTTGSAGTPSGTYTISITGTDVHGVTQSGAPATVTVTVN
jgi:chitodextrinase